MIGHIEYRFGRSDYAAMAAALYRRSWPQRLRRLAIDIVVLVALVAATVTYVAVSEGAEVLPLMSQVGRLLVTGGFPVWFYVLLALFLALVFLGQYLSAAIAAACFKGLATAGQVHTIDLGDDAIVITAPGLSSTIAWSAITRLIETRSRLFLALGKRQAVMLPRRAYASDADFAEVCAFARARISLPRSPG